MTANTRTVGRPRSTAMSAASRHARTATKAPTRTDETCAAANVRPRNAIGTAARRVGSGSHTSNAGREKTSGVP